MSKSERFKIFLKRQRTHPCKGLIDAIFKEIGFDDIDEKIKGSKNPNNDYRYFKRVLSLLLKNHIDYIEKDKFDFFYKGEITEDNLFYFGKCFRLSEDKRQMLIKFLEAEQRCHGYDLGSNVDLAPELNWLRFCCFLSAGGVF